MTYSIVKDLDIAFILRAIEENGGGTPFLVGGCVRDAVLNLPSKDVDIEVFNIDIEDLISTLKEIGSVDLVGKSFGVIKFIYNGNTYDVSVPRTEEKNNHEPYSDSFDVELNTSLSMKEAASRRDFTINAMYMDINGTIHDPYNGMEDIKNRTLRPTTEKFQEDPLRVLRGMQFAARFCMLPSQSCVVYGMNLRNEYKKLPKERVWEEWKKANP